MEVRSTIADRVAAALLPVVERVDRYPAIAGVLRGNWLGHPVHPMLTDLPIGFWTSAWVLDFFPGTRREAQRLIGFGVLTAMPTAMAGLADWPRRSRRKDATTVAHLASNTAATALYAWSWNERRRHRHVRGVVIGQVAAVVATAGGALGGSLAFER